MSPNNKKEKVNYLNPFRFVKGINVIKISGNAPKDST
jgi:hypothetical protein